MDTTMYMSLEDYLKVLESRGFREVLKAPFVGRTWRGLRWQPQDDVYLVYWRSPIIVAFDTFGMRWVNGGYVWYNWMSRKGKFHLESSYWINDNLLIGQHDCRVDFLRTLDMLEKDGNFISPWVEHKLWLVNYVERYEGNNELVTKNRLALLPQEIRECVGNGTYREEREEKKEEAGVPAGPSDQTDTTEVRRCGC
jgi:hypothetical protein